MKKAKKKYVLNDGTKIKRAEEQGNGWLHYELRDGTIGLARPGTWKERGPAGK
jgi:hypothetical protein